MSPKSPWEKAVTATLAVILVAAGLAVGFVTFRLICEACYHVCRCLEALGSMAP